MDEQLDPELQEFYIALANNTAAKLPEAKKAAGLAKVALSMGLNPWTKPFDLLTLGGKTILYANKTAAAQFRQSQGIDTQVTYAGPLRIGLATTEDGKQSMLVDPDTYVVEILAATKDKDNNVRRSYNVGCVWIGGQKGDQRANSIMRCYTKAVRRVTLDHAGCGFLDESETDTIEAPTSKSPNTMPAPFMASAPPLKLKD